MYIYIYMADFYFSGWTCVLFLSLFLFCSVCFYAKVVHTWADSQLCSMTGSVNPSRILPTGALKRGTCSA